MPVRFLLPFLALFFAGAGAACAADPVAQLAEARAAREAKDFPRAEKILAAVIAAHPASSEAYLARGFTWLAQKKNDLAAADFKSAVAVDPTNPTAYLYRGDLAYRMIEGNFAACEADYATVLKLDPAFPHFRAYSAELYLYMKQPTKVIAEATLGLIAEPTAPIHKINLAHGLAFAGQLEAAKALYTAVAPIEIGHGRRGAAFALGDFAQLKRRGLDYPQLAELTPFLEALAQAHP
jgi:tetratricopeptide (TPR) repeat protein